MNRTQWQCSDLHPDLVFVGSYGCIDATRPIAARQLLTHLQKIRGDAP